MKSRMLSIVTVVLALAVVGQAQTVTGSWQLNKVRVVYHNFVRDSVHKDDTGTKGVFATWVMPMADHFMAVDANADSKPDLVWPVVGGSVGSRFTFVSFKETMDPWHLLNTLQINLNVAIDMSAGTGTIPGVAGSITTYPTTATANCVTQPVIAAVTDNLEMSWKGPVLGPQGEIVWGWGINKSDVFDWFVPVDVTKYEPRHKPAYPGAADSSWGAMIGHLSADGSHVERIDVHWHALDGPYATGGSQSGIDEDASSADYLKLNRQGGIVVTADGTTIPGLAALFPTMGINTGSYPMIGGRGFNHDNLESTPGQGVVTPVAAGGTWNSVGYLFNPSGGDGIPFSGDEPLQFTGYYLTANFATAVGAFSTALQTALGTNPTDVEGAITAGVTAVAAAFGLTTTDTTVAGAIAAISTVLNTEFQTHLAGLIAAGMDPIAAATHAAGKVGAAGVVTALGGLKDILTGAGITLDDSGHDWAATAPTAGGRLLFEVDKATAGGICLPVHQVRDVHAEFINVLDWKAPTHSIISDESYMPLTYALHDNYPNPFNPSTMVSFDLPRETYAEVAVYNMMGQRVRTLQSGTLNAGRHHLLFDGHDDLNQQLGSGVYFYRIVAGDFHATKKMMLIK